MPRWLVGAVSFGVGVVVGTVGMALFGSTDNATAGVADPDADPLTGPADNRLSAAVNACSLDNATDEPYATVSDGGHTLTFDQEGEEDVGGLDIIDVFCLLTELEAPTSITSHMGQTTSLDGRQTGSWDGLTVAWSYHPDRGMDGIITVD